MKKIMPCIAVLAFMLLVSQAFAANKTVVIPLKTAKKVKNVVTVLKKGGDFTDPVAAVESIADASDTNPYLVLIGPGKYTLSRTLVMKPYVTIAGSGRDATMLRGAISSGSEAASAVVRGAGNAALRDLSIENIGGGENSIAMYNSSSIPVIRDVTVLASGGTYNYGVYNLFSSPEMTAVTASASGGEYCYGVYNLSLSSPRMADVEVDASGGAYCYGMYNQSGSSPVINGMNATASGGSYNYGVYNSSSSPNMTNVTATASGTAANYGVYNDSSSPVMTNVTATTTGGLERYGVYNDSSSPVIHHSTMDKIHAAGGATKVIQSSILEQATFAGAGTPLTCLLADDGEYSELNSTCQ